ncbi:putative tryptophan transport protein [compost metagenome]
MNKNVVLGIILPIGTLISGTIFLGSASILVGLPGGASFGVLFMGVVLPAVIINLIAGFALFKVFETSLRRSGLTRDFNI